VKDNLIGADALITAFAQHRRTLLKHTSDLLCGEEQPVSGDGRERATELSAVLVASLEELKVAEEELVERTEALANLRDELEQRVRGARSLFDLAPAHLLVTDVYGSIVDANLACQQLLKRDLADLERQPLARFIAPDERRAFRGALSRVVASDGVNEWRLVLVRPTAGPLAVSAAVRVVKAIAEAGQRRLFWSIRPTEEPGTIDA
jgi:PAS domain-containing protein